jgi:CheY-like chemotaxis protein/two-component sensor histidine kinase
LQLRKERVELAEIVRTAVETSRPFIDTQHHEFIITLPEDPVYLDVDPTRLAQVIANLLNNAAKYTKKNGQLRLHAEQRDGDVVISVQDNGIGISAEHLPNIFQMFSQAAPALERAQGGLGIGLSLVKGLVQLHGGRIEAHSDGPGTGSEFVVHLPVAATTTEKASETLPATISPPQKRRILYVDDNQDTVNSMAMLLRMLGHEVRTAADGEEALQAAAEYRPEIAFLDIGLPKLNGYEVAQRIRNEDWGRDMLLIALTGWGQEEDKRRATAAGFDHHLTKPVKTAIIENLLAQPLPSRN